MSMPGGVSGAVARRILERLDASGQSVNALAARTGIPRPTLDRYLKLTPHLLGLGQLEVIADALNVSFEELLALQSVPA